MKSEERKTQNEADRKPLTLRPAPQRGEGNAEPTNGARTTRRVQEWWDRLAPGERRLICSVMGLLRGAKRSQLRDVASAAAKWERGIGCFIKVRLMAARPRVSITVRSDAAPKPGAQTTASSKGTNGTEGTKDFRRDAETDPRDGGSATGMNATSCPLISRSPRGVFPGRD